MTTTKNFKARKVGTVAAVLAVIAIAGVAGTSINSTSVTAQTSAQAMPRSLAHIIDKVAPAVVSVQVTQGGRAVTPPEMTIPEPFRRFFDDEMMRRFFGENFDERSERQGQEPRFRTPERAAIGSGFIIDPEGYIVTNNHVVSNATEITVKMKEGEPLEAKLIGSDPKTDLALLKVESDEELPFVEFGNSDNAKVGDWVIALGSPFGLGHTATTGIISARGRNIGAGPYDDFLQIDAPINRGNSGGPLFNLDGTVIGVNTAIFSPSGGNVGIGFAIPSAIAKDVIVQLKETGSVERGWLGVTIQPVTDEIAQSLGLEEAKGAIVAQVNQGSPAAKAGLRQGDVILSVDGKAVDEFREVARLVANVEPGKQIELGIWRDGDRKTLDVEVGLQPETPQAAAVQPSDVLGMQLAGLNERTRRAYDIGSGVTGVVIAEVEPGSAAAEQGLREGDVIVRVDQQAVETPSDVAQRIQKAEQAKRPSVLLLISRNDQAQFVALPVRPA